MAYDTASAYSSAPHRLELSGREKLLVTGVEDVERFDESEIVMATAQGILIVTGEGLHIGSLSLDGGELRVEGKIDTLGYEDGAAGGRQGLFHRLFGG